MLNNIILKKTENCVIVDNRLVNLNAYYISDEFIGDVF